MQFFKKLLLFFFVVLCALSAAFYYFIPPQAVSAESACVRKTQNVILITLDGLRWQETFMGADEKFMKTDVGKVDDVEGLKKLYWAETPEARREKLLPFFWKTLAKEGQLFGNHKKNSKVGITNGLYFSYPGYHELLVGFADARINSNAKNPNPNVTVLEWLNGLPAYKDKVAAFGSWDVFPYILNRARAKFFVNAGWEAVEGKSLTKKQKDINAAMFKAKRHWEGTRHDEFTFPSALEYFKEKKPRVFYVAFGDTDEWAHGSEYDNYLNAAKQTSDDIETLWKTAQGMKEYKGKTAMLITTDHGRGVLPNTWQDHGFIMRGAQYIWIAAIGPDTKPLGERENTDTLAQSQIAATVAALLGENYNAFQPSSVPPVQDVLLSCN